LIICLKMGLSKMQTASWKSLLLKTNCRSTLSGSVVT
jgi:hypothetical protein